MKKLIIIFLFLILLTSCFKKDEKISPHKSPVNDSVQTNTIPLTQNYIYQFFFNLNTNKIVSRNLRSIWDIGFESSPDGWHIILNTSKYMKAAQTNQPFFGATTKLTGLKFTFDMSSGNLDSTAIGLWGDTTALPITSFNKTYVIDRGLDETGKSLGYKKMIISAFDLNNDYNIDVANLDGTDYYRGIIHRDSSTTFTCFSFDNGGQTVKIEPDKTTWDLMFTQYTTNLKLNNVPYPYLVTGVLINRYKVKANRINDLAFEKISFDKVSNMTLSSRLDTVGYAWKEYSRITGHYSIVSNKYFVIKSVADDLYKLRFTNFYNDQGEKGYPSFLFQKLK